MPLKKTNDLYRGQVRIGVTQDGKRAEGKDPMTVIGHICRKMIFIIFAVLRDNTPYVPAAIPD